MRHYTDTQYQRMAPSGLKLSECQHLGYYKAEGNFKLNKSDTVRMLHHTTNKCGNMTNMRYYCACWHPELWNRNQLASNQTIILNTITKVPFQLERARPITKSIETKILKASNSINRIQTVDKIIPALYRIYW